MRQAAFRASSLVDLATYPPEARLFERVDQPIVAATFLVGREWPQTATMRVFDQQQKLKATHQIPIDAIRRADESWRIPVAFGQGTINLDDRFAHLPTFRSLEGQGNSDLWAGRELDETRLVDKLVSTGTAAFVKGRMINRHRIVTAPAFFVRDDFIAAAKWIDQPRLVWRDVARSSQERRMIGCMIPGGWIAGNSLHVACFRDNSVRRLSALYGVMMSLVFEFQVRSIVSTGHMSLGAVRRAKIPVLRESDINKLYRMVSGVLKRSQGDDDLEVAVARMYNLNRDDFSAVLDAFPKLSREKRCALLASDLWTRTID
jgi:Alw26I/Eco31I/Esp3I family type II restriction m6 adenine DNA methyltransferase